MKSLLSTLSRRDIATAAVFLCAIWGMYLWQAGKFSFASLLAATLSTILFFALFVGSLLFVAWAVRRIALKFGIPLGPWGSIKSIKAFVSRQDRTLERLDAKQKPAARGRTQFLRGLALGELGTRSDDADALRQSVDAFRDALPALHAAGKNAKWALTQSNLAVSLLMLHRRTAETGLLEDAVVALESAAEVWREADNMADWAEAQSALCGVLTELGQVQDGTERLEDAVAAGRAALEAEDNSDVPMADAKLQINLTDALAALGEREAATGHLEEAATMARTSLDIVTEDRDDILTKDESVHWRLLLTGTLGRALLALGTRRDATEMLRDTADLLRSTAPLRTESSAYDWAMARHTLARALASLGDRDKDPALRDESISASDAALAILTKEAYPLGWAIATTGRADTVARLPDDQSGPAPLRRALDDLDAALAVFEETGALVQGRACRDVIARVQARMDAASGSRPGDATENSDL